MDPTDKALIDELLTNYAATLEKAELIKKMLDRLGYRGELPGSSKLVVGEPYIVGVDAKYSTLKDGILAVLDTAKRCLSVNQIERALRYNILSSEADPRYRRRKVSQALYATASIDKLVASIRWPDWGKRAYVWGKRDWFVQVPGADTLSLIEGYQPVMDFAESGEEEGDDYDSGSGTF